MTSAGWRKCVSKPPGGVRTLEMDRKTLYPTDSRILKNRQYGSNRDHKVTGVHHVYVCHSMIARHPGMKEVQSSRIQTLERLVGSKLEAFSVMNGISVLFQAFKMFPGRISHVRIPPIKRILFMQVPHELIPVYFRQD